MFSSAVCELLLKVRGRVLGDGSTSGTVAACTPAGRGPSTRASILRGGVSMSTVGGGDRQGGEVGVGVGGGR